MAQSSHVKPLVRGPTDLVQSHESTNFGTLNHTFIFWRIQLYIYMCISISELGAQPQLPHAFMVKTLPPGAAGGAAGACGDSQGYEWDGSKGATDVQKWLRFADLFAEFKNLVRGSNILRQTFFCVCGLNTCMLMSVYIYIHIPTTRRTSWSFLP